MNRSMIDLWVGIFVAVGFAALLFLALKVGNLATFSTNQTYQVHAKFANIGGLKVRSTSPTSFRATLPPRSSPRASSASSTSGWKPAATA
jgi:hypothetical protein